MDIFLYDNNNREYINLPVIPKSVQISSPQKIETFETLGQGDLKLIGVKGNRKLSLESFFPKNNNYSFQKSRQWKGMQNIDRIELWRGNRSPLTLIISDLNINFKCVITNLNYEIKDGTGDIYYNLDIEEYKVPFYGIKTTPSTTKKISTVKTEKVETYKSTYGIVTADILNVRDGNGTNYKILGTLKKGDKVKLFRLESNNKWWHIYYGNHGGHVSAEYIRRI